MRDEFFKAAEPTEEMRQDIPEVKAETESLQAEPQEQPQNGTSAKEKDDEKSPLDKHARKIERIKKLQELSKKDDERIERQKISRRKREQELAQLKKQVLDEEIEELLAVIQQCGLGIPQITEFMKFVLDKSDIEHARKILERNV